MATTREERRPMYLNDAKRFGTFVDELVEEFEAMVELNKSAGMLKAGVGKELLFNIDGVEYALNTRAIKSLNTTFKNRLKSVKKVVSTGFTKKKDREPGDPSTLKGIYGPVYSGVYSVDEDTGVEMGAINQFITNGNFGFVEPDNDASGALIDELNLARQGYFLRNTLNNLFYIHIYAEELQNNPNAANIVTSSDAMRAAFGGTIPSLYVQRQIGTRTETKIVYNKKTNTETEIQKVKPVYEKIDNANALNTFDAIQTVRPNFNPDAFELFYLQSISSLNLYTREHLKCDDNLRVAYDHMMEDAEVRQQLLDEHQIVNNASVIWRQIREPERKRRSDVKKAQRKAEGRR